jgi:hypothetical protein
LLTPAEVAEIRHRTEVALAQERTRKVGPPYIKDGGRILYPEDLLYEYLDARMVRPETAE